MNTPRTSRLVTTAAAIAAICIAGFHGAAALQTLDVAAFSQAAAVMMIGLLLLLCAPVLCWGAVTVGQVVKRQDGNRGFGPAAVAVLYEGTLAFNNASGYVDDDVASGVNKFAGVVITEVDNSGGAAGDLSVDLWTEGVFELQGTGFTQGTVGSDIYASDNYTVTTSSSSTTWIGRCVGYVSSTKILVKILVSNDPANITALDIDDDEEAIFGTGDDALILWSTGDASNHTLVIALGNSNQALHITDNGAKATDWNVAADTDPTLYIHSNTTPATDYITIGGHDGTTATINVAGGTTLNVDIAGTTSVHFDGDGIGLADDVSVVLGTGSDAELLWSTGDADNHAVVLAIGDSSQALHITDLGARASDWNVAANTHPNVYIHSNTTPTTDYLRIGDHDGTEADIDVVGGTSLALKLAGTEYASVRVTGLAVGSYVAAATAGTDQVTIKSTGTAPVGTGANVGHLYADFETDDDELFWLSGTNGTATQLTT